MREIELSILECMEGKYQFTIPEIAQKINKKEETIRKPILQLIKKGLIKKRESAEDTMEIGRGIHRRTYMGMEPQYVSRYFLTKKGIRELEKF